MIHGEDDTQNDKNINRATSGNNTSTGHIFAPLVQHPVYVATYALQSSQPPAFNNGRHAKTDDLSHEQPPDYSRQPGFDQDDSSFPSDEKEDTLFCVAGNPKLEKREQAKTERRTLALRGLSDRATHKDVVDVIRGGALLEIYLRPRQQMACVSFIDGEAAQAFLAYAKRHDIYILGKRVSCHHLHHFLTGL